MTKELVSILVQAVDGLLYQSETDAPFEVFVWSECSSSLTPQDVLIQTALPPDTIITQQTMAQFFAPLTQEKDWYGPEERATMQRYRNLQSLLYQHIPEAQVFRVGKVEVTIYLVGHGSDGKCVGLKTVSVET